MKKIATLGTAALAAALAFGMASCGSKKAAAEADTADTAAVAQEMPQAPQMAVDTLKYGPKFFDDASKKSAVATDSTYAETPSGLKYVVTREGTGASPKASDTVEVHYTGRLLDGTVFDSSYNHGQSISFPLNGVIRGWTEGLQLMKEGGSTVFYIPSNLAYGEAGTPGGPIPPNADLIFEVSLIQVK